VRDHWSQKSRDVLVYVVGRPLLFVLWSLVAWGTVYGLVLLWAIVDRGPVAAFHQALSTDAVGGVANLSLAGVAGLVWALVGLAVWRGRTRRRRARPTNG
jgi:hypothetical protein